MPVYVYGETVRQLQFRLHVCVQRLSGLSNGDGNRIDLGRVQLCNQAFSELRIRRHRLQHRAVCCRTQETPAKGLFQSRVHPTRLEHHNRISGVLPCRKRPQCLHAR